MSAEVSVAVVGGGGNYTPELVGGILAHRPEELPIRELRLYDVNAERLELMAGLSRRMIAASDRRLDVRVFHDLSPAVADVDFVVSQIRVGGMTARHLDESIPLKYGIIGQETTGPGGMFKALRTIPVMIDIAREVSRMSPRAMILNYTNPSGIMAEAVLNHTGAGFVGLCSGIPGLQMVLQQQLLAKFGEIEIGCVGLNHVGFVHQVRAGGVDVIDEAIAEVARQIEESADSYRRWIELARVLRAFPMPGYSEYYFRRRRAVDHQREAESTRAQQIMALEREVYAFAADPNTRTTPPALQFRGGGGYSQVTFAVLKAMLGGGEPRRIVMSVLNHGTTPDLPPSASVEVVCEVDAKGPHPLPVGDIPIAFRGLVQAMKAHETLVIEAAVTRRRDLALQAMLANPLVGDLDVAEPLLDEMLAAHDLDFS